LLDGRRTSRKSAAIKQGMGSRRQKKKLRCDNVGGEKRKRDKRKTKKARVNALSSEDHRKGESAMGKVSLTFRKRGELGGRETMKFRKRRDWVTGISVAEGQSKKEGKKGQKKEGGE